MAVVSLSIEGYRSIRSNFKLPYGQVRLSSPLEVIDTKSRQNSRDMRASERPLIILEDRPQIGKGERVRRRTPGRARQEPHA